MKQAILKQSRKFLPLAILLAFLGIGTWMACNIWINSPIYQFHGISEIDCDNAIALTLEFETGVSIFQIDDDELCKITYDFSVFDTDIHKYTSMGLDMTGVDYRFRAVAILIGIVFAVVGTVVAVRTREVMEPML